MGSRAGHDSRDTPTLAVLGANGQVGHELLRALAPLGSVTGFTRDALDITDTPALERALEQLRPAVVVNAAAYTAVDRAEREPDLAWRVNAHAPGVLAGICARLGARLIHYSTDYVFDGSARRPYRESDPTAPLGVYGRTKRAGEERVLAANPQALILRTAWVYGLHGRNFLLTMQRLGRQAAGSAEGLRVVADQTGSPTPAWFIADVTARIVATCLAGPTTGLPGGIYHLTAAGQTSWCDFARQILASSPGCEGVAVTGIPTSDYPTPARRPAWSVLDTRRLQQALAIKIPHWQQLLRETLGKTSG